MGNGKAVFITGAAASIGRATALTENVFLIRNRGVVATGRVESGVLRPGDTVHIDGGPGVTVDAIESFRKELDEANVGDNIGVLFKGIDKSQLPQGAILTSSGEAPPIETTTVIV